MVASARTLYRSRFYTNIECLRAMVIPHAFEDYLLKYTDIAVIFTANSCAYIYDYYCTGNGQGPRHLRTVNTHKV